MWEWKSWKTWRWQNDDAPINYQLSWLEGGRYLAWRVSMVRGGLRSSERITIAGAGRSQFSPSVDWLWDGAELHGYCGDWRLIARVYHMASLPPPGPANTHTSVFVNTDNITHRFEHIYIRHNFVILLTQTLHHCYPNTDILHPLWCWWKMELV